MNAKHAMTGFAVAMLVYSGWRSFDYMAGSLQGVNSAVSLLIAIAFLCFSEIGLLLWLHLARPAATTDSQETVATTMIWVDFVGSMALGLADLAKHNTLYVVNLSVLDPFLFLAPWLLVVANVGGYLLYHMSDAEGQIERAERQLRHAESRLDIETRHEAIRQVSAQRQAVSKDLAPLYAAEMIDRVNGRAAQRFGRKVKAAQDDTPGKPAPTVTRPAPAAAPAPLAQAMNAETDLVTALETDPNAPSRQNGRHS